MDLLSTKDVSILLGVTPAMIGNYCNSGRLSGSFRVGRAWLIPQTAVDNFERPKIGRPPKQKTAVFATAEN